MKGFVGLNRWGALAFVFVAMIGALALVGTEENSDALLNAAEKFGEQSGEVEEEPASQPELQPLPSPPVAEIIEEEEPLYEFASDEDLVVDPTGIDPTPVISDPAEGEEIEFETVEK